MRGIAVLRFGEIRLRDHWVEAASEQLVCQANRSTGLEQRVLIASPIQTGTYW